MATGAANIPLPDFWEDSYDPGKMRALVESLEQRFQAQEAAVGGDTSWGDINGTLSDQTDLQSALDAKVEDWGDIGGTLSNQTDLQNALNGKVPTSRTLTGGHGINSIGNLSANRTISVDKTANYNWTGTHDFNAVTNFTDPVNITSYGNTHFDQGVDHNIFLTYGSTGRLQLRTYNGTGYTNGMAFTSAGYLDITGLEIQGHNNSKILKDHGNGVVTLSAQGATLYLGYQTTDGIRANVPFTEKDIELQNITINRTSDLRQKDVHRNYVVPFEAIQDKEPILYNYKGKKNVGIGWGAQDIEPFAPEAVSVGSNGYLTLDHDAVNAAFIGSLIAEVKNLRHRVSALEAE